VDVFPYSKQSTPYFWGLGRNSKNPKSARTAEQIIFAREEKKAFKLDRGDAMAINGVPH
jgi:hypothetical protein